MMSGIEAVGLALSIIPVVVEILDFYSGSLTSRDVSFLAESLKNRELIFKNAVEELLNSILSKEELRELLRNPRGLMWTDDSISTRMEQHLGAEAGDLLEIAKEIHRTVYHLKEKLPPVGSGDPKLLPRAKQVIKSFLHGPQNRSSLKRLKARIDDFVTLTGQSLRLAPLHRTLPYSLRNLNQLQERARGLYAALKDVWQCDCSHLHPTNLRLEVWQSQPKTSHDDNFRFRFLFSFATATEDVRSELWKAVEIVPRDVDEDAQSAPDDKDQVTPHSIVKDYAQRADKLPQQTPSKQPPATARVKFQLSEPASPSPVDQKVAEEQTSISDICTLLSSLQDENPSEARRLGHINDKEGRKYSIFTIAGKAPPNSATSSTYHLGEIFSRPSQQPNVDQKSTRDALKTTTLKNSERVRLALMLGWNALQLHSTHWLEDHWTKDNILLVIDPPNIPQPYVTHNFQSRSRRNSKEDLDELTLTPSRRERLTSWVPNEALFNLGVVLIEICYNKSIEALADASEKDEKGEPHSQTAFLTAMRLSKEVQDEFGIAYASAVRGCLRCNFSSGQSEPDLGSEQFRTSFWQHIIKPLQDVADIWGKSAPSTVVA